MGYIPILIALLAFSVLVILFNISNIRAHQHSLGLALFTVCQTAKSRNALLKRLRGVHANLLCPTLPKDHRLLPGLIPQIDKFISAEWTSLSDSQFFISETRPNDGSQRYTAALAVLNQRQEINLRTFERKVREYNKLLNTAPTAMVAALYGIKPVKFVSSRRQKPGSFLSPEGGTS